MAQAGPHSTDSGGSKPVRVYTLGRFQVHVDGAPLQFEGRAPRRPLSLLKALVALDGDSVPIETLCDALWPDADGDRAEHAFRAALHRLRGLLGNETAPLANGRLSLSPEHCWVDAHACLAFLESAQVAAGNGDAEGAWRDLEQALALHVGPFLGDESEPSLVLSARGRLQGELNQRLERLATFFGERGDLTRALHLYRHGFDRDESSEILAQGLMRCCREQGRTAEALAVYRRLRAALEQRTGMAVSPETEALCRTLDEAPAAPAATGEPAPEETRGAVETLRREAMLPLPDFPSIVVLPFTSLGGDPGEDALAAGFSDNIVTDLARLRNLVLVAAGPTEVYRSRPPDVRRIGRDLGVRFVLDGSVQQEGGRVRVAAQLIDAATGRHLWAERYDRTMRDLFLVQDDIGRQIVIELEVKLAEGEMARVWRTLTPDTRNYEAFTLGMGLLRQVRGDANQQARACFEEVLAKNPVHSHALAGLGFSHYLDARYGWSASREESLDLAEQLAGKALALDPDTGTGHLTISNVMRTRGRWEESLVSMHRALECAPDRPIVHAQMAGLLVCMARPAEAISHYRRAMRLHPYFPPWVLGGLGRAYWLLGRTAEAQAAFEEVIGRHADEVHFSRGPLIVLLVEMGRLEEARRHAASILATDPAFSAHRLITALCFRDPAVNERLRKALRAAGLPD